MKIIIEDGDEAYGLAPGTYEFHVSTSEMSIEHHTMLDMRTGLERTMAPSQLCIQLHGQVGRPEKIEWPRIFSRDEVNARVRDEERKLRRLAAAYGMELPTESTPGVDPSTSHVYNEKYMKKIAEQALAEMVAAPPPPIGRNPSFDGFTNQCDVETGPCACGAWHDPKTLDFLSRRVLPETDPQHFNCRGLDKLKTYNVTAVECDECHGSGEWENPANGRRSPCSRGCKK